MPINVSGGPVINAVVAENRLRGDPGWDVTREPEPAAASGFLSAASVVPGDSVALRVAGPGPVDVEWYRLGWYGGAGGRLIRIDPQVAVAPIGRPLVDATTGLAEATGGATTSVTIDRDWPSGAYVAVLRPSADDRAQFAASRSVRRGRGALGGAGAIPFTVRAGRAGRPAPILFVQATATWQAYNVWGGADLYRTLPGNSPTRTSGMRAVQVSYDRPYAGRHGLGLMPRWELDFIRWQEREGLNVDYCADVDLELHPEVVRGRRLILVVGHAEYWSRPMRTTLETAIATGTNAAFLAADNIAWQIRFEPSSAGPGRRITCYKASGLDPDALANPPLTTCRWREPPVDDPEATTIGEMYGHVISRVSDWIVHNADHWLYAGTGLRDGDHLANLIGPEYDTYYPSLAPPGTTLLARSPVIPVLREEPAGNAGADAPLDDRLHTATIYTTASGSTVFAAGTFQWSWALDAWGDRTYKGVTTPVDERVARMTRNLVDRLG